MSTAPNTIPPHLQKGGKTQKRYKRPIKSPNGTYSVKGKIYKLLFGSRQQVWNSTAYKTPGNLTKSDLVQNDRRRIVSKKKYLQGKRELKNKSRLFKNYTAKKGHFGPVKR